MSMKRYDLLQDINTRGTFALTRAALPHLEVADNPRILTLSPPLNLEPRWAGGRRRGPRPGLLPSRRAAAAVAV